jgi:hypothetical protein
MRTNVGNGRARTWRKLLVMASAGFMVLSALGTGSVLAARPNLIVTGNAAPGTANDAASTAQPTAVSTSETVQFTTSIYNADTSNVSQLYFSTSALPAGATVSKISSDRAGCATTSTPLCTFGALRPQESVRVTIIFTTPSTADSTLTECPLGSTGYQGGILTTLTGNPQSFCVDLRWYANGFPTSDGGNSHGDFFDWFDGTTLNGDAINFHGRFVYLDGQKVTGNSLNVSNSNKQGTQVSVNDLNIPVTVLDGPTVPRICTTTIVLIDGSTFDCTTLSSETSEVNVAKGNNVSLFAILVKFYQAPGNLKGSSPVALHQFTDPATGLLRTEAISSQCQLKSGVPTAQSPIPCLVVANGGKQGTIWTRHNGKFNY